MKNINGAAALFATALLTAALFAQGTGAITGTILSIAGAGVAVPKALVQARNTGTGASWSARSDADRKYTISGVAPGNFELSVENPPFFVPFSRKDIQVEAGTTVRIDVRLDDLGLNTLGDGGERRPAAA